LKFIFYLKKLIAMWDYIIVLCGFLVLIAIKIFLVVRTYDKNKNFYQRPGDLAKDIIKTNKPDVKKFLQDIQNVEKLTLLMLRNLFLIREFCIILFCSYSFLGKKVKNNETKDCTQIVEKFRQMAIMMNIVLLQHEKDTDKTFLAAKINEVEKEMQKVAIVFLF
jgi:hypothetical protein